MIQLKRPLVVFDLESTGLDIASDCIIQIAYVKLLPDGSESRGCMLVRPTKPIPQNVSELTGITNADVADKATFKEQIDDIRAVFEGCDLAGYNSNHFDVPLLVEEFLRAGEHLDLSGVSLIDARGIFCKMEQRNLAAAYEFYCGRKMAADFEAHRADQDAEATYRVLKGQLEMYSPARQSDPSRVLPDSLEKIAEFTKQGDNIDFAGRFVKVDGVETFNFGKHKGKPMADVLLHRDPSYFQWMMNGNFSLDTKQWLQRIYFKYRRR